MRGNETPRAGESIPSRAVHGGAEAKKPVSQRIAKVRFAENSVMLPTVRASREGAQTVLRDPTEAVKTPPLPEAHVDHGGIEQPEICRDNGFS